LEWLVRLLYASDNETADFSNVYDIYPKIVVFIVMYEDEMRKISLETYSTLQNIEKIKKFMFADLDKTIALVSSDRGAPNFMLALVLCSYTEFWGKLMLHSEDEKKCFDAFFCRLGTRYEELIENTDAGIYGRIRCGLVHEYLIKGNAKIVVEGGDCGIIYDTKTKTYTFCIKKYLEDFKFAVNNYIEELKTDLEKFDNAKKVLEKGAKLL
jgi:hypothetical protein